MSKVIFILHRKDGTTREQCLEYWGGDRHTSIVGRIPGLTRWVQNHVGSAPGEPAACDGVGELWFESDDAMQRALSSPEMGAAVEDAPGGHQLGVRMLATEEGGHEDCVVASGI